MKRVADVFKKGLIKSDTSPKVHPDNSGGLESFELPLYVNVPQQPFEFKNPLRVARDRVYEEPDDLSEARC